jgi:iron complex outermembrane receptor protein
MTALGLRRALVSAAAVTALASGAPVWAQDSNRADASDAAAARRGGAQVGEIVVTAQRREQRLQDVPVAVTALTQDALVVNRVANIRDLDAIAPGLLVKTTVGGSALPSYTLRGIFTAGNVVGADKGVGVYVDGVYIGASHGAISNLADIERIEVLRGPQGTLFGRNSTGGAISFTTREPSGEFGLKQTFTLGDYDQFRSATSLSSPQLGPFSALVSYVHSERRGDVRNLGAGTKWDLTRAYGGKTTILTSPKYMGDSNSESVLGSVKGDFGDLVVINRFDYSEEDYSTPAYGMAYLAPPTLAVRNAQPNQAIMTPITRKRPKAVNDWATTPGHNQSWGDSLTATWRVNSAVTLKNIAAYRESKVRSGLQDISGFGGLVVTADPAAATFLGILAAPRPITGTPALGTPIVWQMPSTVSDIKQWSEEFQVNLDTRWVTMTAGGLYYRQKSLYGYLGDQNGVGLIRNGGALYLPGFSYPSLLQPAEGGGRYSIIKQVSRAAYAQAEGHVTDRIDLVAGIRYTKDRKIGVDNTAYTALNPLSLPVYYRKGQTTYNVGVNYKPTSDILLYAKYSTGYISGGQVSTLSYDPEKAKSAEAGIKADWLEHRLRTNLALYSVKYEGIQFQSSPRSSPLFANLVPLGITQLLINAGSARAKGAELETVFTPARALMFQANLSYLDFKYLTLSPAISAGAVDVPPQSRPKWTAQLAAQYTSDPIYGDAHITARIDANFKSRQFLGVSLPAAQTANTGLLTGNFAAIYTPAEMAAYKKALTADAYWLVNARIGLDDIAIGQFKGSVALWARNLFNDKSMVYGVGIISAAVGVYEPARTFGVDVTMNF